MKKTLLTTSLIAMWLVSCAETISVKSPDGFNEIVLKTEPRLTYQVLRGGQALTEPSAISLEVAGKGVLGGAAGSVVRRETSDRQGKVKSPIYKKAIVDETARGTVVWFGDWAIELIARNDGVAYRYVTAFPEKEVVVKAERADVVFASGEQVVYAAPNSGAGEGDPLQNSWEGVYRRRAVKDAPKDFSNKKNGLWYAPLTFVYPNGVVMAVQESDLWSYPGWNFQGGADGRSLKALFAAYPKKMIYANWGVHSTEPARYQRILERDGFLARTKGSRTYPWRVFTLAPSLAKLAEADIVYALASPNAIGDLSWVKPGKVSWDWWCNWNLTGVDFRAGINTKSYERFIDFASKNGVEYVIFDEGWSQKLKILEINPEVDVPHLIRYANERGVGIILWAAWSQFHGRAEQVVDHYAKMGAKGFKVDFMDRDDQAALDFLQSFAAICARHKMLVDYHGMSKPAGFQRTYPNVLNFEGVHGLECLKGGKEELFPEMDCTIAFTRCAAGPVDYTPGAMRNACRGRYQPFPWTPGSIGTRVHQMALMLVYEAPLEMLCDSPSQYEANRECFDFMSSLPVVWDDTIGLGGEMDAFAAVARRKGETWYVGSICGWNGRDGELETSFLGTGEWNAEIFADGVNADRDAVDYARSFRRVKAGEKLSCRLAPGGGWVARFVRRDSKEIRVTEKNGEAIQRAIYTLVGRGGGRVVVPAGEYPSRSLRLASNVELHLEKGATIKGSSNPFDYTPSLDHLARLGLVQAYGCTNVSITGEGRIAIDGAGFFDLSAVDLWGKYYHAWEGPRPEILQMVGCKGVRLEGVSFVDSPLWTMRLRRCEDVTIDRVRVLSDKRYINSDGIDIDGCRRVVVRNSTFVTGDDCLILRAIPDPNDKRQIVTEDVLVENCDLDSGCQAIRIGCPSDDTIRNAAFRNIRARGFNGIFIDNPLVYLSDTDEGRLDLSNVTIENFKGEFSGCALRLAVDPGIALRGIRDITFRNVEVSSPQPVRLVGNTRSKFERICCENFKVNGKSLPEGEIAIDCTNDAPLKRVPHTIGKTKTRPRPDGMKIENQRLSY